MNFALHIIDECLAQGVTHFCSAPGARSTPLVVALAKNKRAQTHVHFDERGLAFFALGLSKRVRRPVAIITTSGSAVGNLLPALMEADSAHISLVLITADRPFELKGCGANQTTEQEKIFAPFVRHHIDLPASDTHISSRVLRQKVAHALFAASAPRRGPVHINCRFREPFLPLHDLERGHSSIQYSQGASVPSSLEFEKWARAMESCTHGIILAGADAFHTFPSELHALAEKVHWPILADPLSGARCTQSLSVRYYNFHMGDDAFRRCDGILQFGDRFVSKSLLQWIEKSPPSFYGLVSEHPHHFDPLHLLTHRMTCPPSLFCTEILDKVSVTENREWLLAWHKRSKEVKTGLDALFAQQETVSEPGLFHFLKDYLPSSWSLFVANSMPIRDVDTFFFPSLPQYSLMANRGVSGIDGTIATACGCADIAIVGDLAALHDINSLALFHLREKPLILIVINNQGGGIFSFLPCVRAEKECFETHFAAAHPYTFNEGAALFNIPYSNPQTKRALEEDLLALFNEPKSVMIEINTDRRENHTLHQMIHSLCSPTL